MYRHLPGRPRRTVPFLHAVVTSGLTCVAVLAAALPAAAVPAPAGTATVSAPVPRAATVLFEEGFENAPGAPRLLTSYTGAPPLAQTYTADPAWLTACNGWLVSAADPAIAPAGSGCGTSWPSQQAMAAALAEWAGGDPAANHAVTAYTAGNPGAGKTQLETVQPVPVAANGLPGRRRHPLVELAVEDQRREARVPVEVDQLLLHVTVVDVHRHQPRLQGSQDRLEVLDPVVEVQPQVLARAETRVDEVVGDAVGGGVEFGVREAPLGTRTGMVHVQERLAVGDHVDDRLEQVGKVVLHRSS